jgi:cell division septum initiation protein DivIVA
VDIEWLDSLETRVRGAAERLRDLKEENGTLKARVRELEAAGSGDAGGLQEENATLAARNRELEERLAAGEKEREEIRRRVEALTLRLEELAGV